MSAMSALPHPPQLKHWPAAPAMQNEAHFGDRVVRCFEQRPRSVHALLEQAALQHPNREALISGERRETWRSLAAVVGATAAGLQKLGVQRGDRVLLLLGNGAEFVIAACALAQLGAVAVPLSVRSAAPEVDYVATQSGAMLAISEDILEPLLPAGLARLLVSGFAALATIAGKHAGKHAGTHAAHAAPPAPVLVDEEDTAVILYTSGTTGRPKGAMLTHFNIVHSAMHYQACMALGASDRSLVAVPLSHVTGLVAQMHTMLLCAGTLVLLDGFKASAFLQLAAREKITHTLMVPAMYQLCLLQDNFAAHGLSAWRVGAYGGAPMAQATIAALATALPALTLLNCYGATETTSPATVMPAGGTASHPESVGVAVPCGELRIVDGDGCVLPAGETGEIHIGGPMVVKGYWNNPQATLENFSAGFWRSGDLGCIDEDGFVQVLDRIKDVINRGGYKVFSSEVEAVLVQHPAVIEAAIVAYACPVLGERVMAFVTIKASVKISVSGDDLKAFCAQRLADYKVPERWSLRSEPLPRNANGKLMKRPLREAV